MHIYINTHTYIHIYTSIYTRTYIHNTHTQTHTHTNTNTLTHILQKKKMSRSSELSCPVSLVQFSSVKPCCPQWRRSRYGELTNPFVQFSLVQFSLVQFSLVKPCCPQWRRSRYGELSFPFQTLHTNSQKSVSCILLH